MARAAAAEAEGSRPSLDAGREADGRAETGLLAEGLAAAAAAACTGAAGDMASDCEAVLGATASAGMLAGSALDGTDALSSAGEEDEKAVAPISSSAERSPRRSSSSKPMPRFSATTDLIGKIVCWTGSQYHIAAADD